MCNQVDKYLSEVIRLEISHFLGTLPSEFLRIYDYSMTNWVTIRWFICDCKTGSSLSFGIKSPLHRTLFSLCCPVVCGLILMLMCSFRDIARLSGLQDVHKPKDEENLVMVYPHCIAWREWSRRTWDTLSLGVLGLMSISTFGHN